MYLQCLQAQLQNVFLVVNVSNVLLKALQKQPYFNCQENKLLQSTNKTSIPPFYFPNVREKF